MPHGVPLGQGLHWGPAFDMLYNVDDVALRQTETQIRVLIQVDFRWKIIQVASLWELDR